jgi:hypothetical protein
VHAARTRLQFDAVLAPAHADIVAAAACLARRRVSKRMPGTIVV